MLAVPCSDGRPSVHTAARKRARTPKAADLASEPLTGSMASPPSRRPGICRGVAADGAARARRRVSMTARPAAASRGGTRMAPDRPPAAPVQRREDSARPGHCSSAGGAVRASVEAADHASWLTVSPQQFAAAAARGSSMIARCRLHPGVAFRGIGEPGHQRYRGRQLSASDGSPLAALRCVPATSCWSRPSAVDCSPPLCEPYHGIDCRPGQHLEIEVQIVETRDDLGQRFGCRCSTRGPDSDAYLHCRH